MIQIVTGTFLFASSLASVDSSNFLVAAGSDTQRLGSFFIDPNWSGTCYAMLFFIGLGLFIESTRLWSKLFYAIECTLILVGLLSTYSAGAVTGLIIGVLVFALFVGRFRHALNLGVFIVVITLLLLVWFPSQLGLLLQHASKSEEVTIRLGAWTTALRVILAFPLTGVGMGVLAYAQRSAPFMTLEQGGPLGHPHNSYLELAAMGGIPLLFVFVILVLFTYWLAMRNWMNVDVRDRCLLAGGIAAIVALSVNSITINGWTLPPLAAIAWLILGAVSSPLLTKAQEGKRRSIGAM
jgi:O-antigen ligase